MQSISTKIKIALAYNQMNCSQLCDKIHFSKANMSTMMKKDVYRTDFLEKIANNLGYELEINFIDKQTGLKI